MKKLGRSDLFESAKATLAKGHNIVEHLTKDKGADRATAIEIAYSLQSGTYTSYASTETAKATRLEGHDIVARTVRDMGLKTVLDCGAGEGTRWFDFPQDIEKLVLLDASFHRLLYARQNIAEIPQIKTAEFTKANMLNIPFASGSFDLVFTSHAVEPNNDKDAEQIISSMFSVAQKAVIMLEPNYRDAHPQMRTRMEKHGYAQNIWDVAHAQAGFECIEEGMLTVSPNPDNATSYMVFRRTVPLEAPEATYVSSQDGRPMSRFSGGFIDDADCMAFPVFCDIACLAPEDGIFLGHNPDSLLEP